MDHYRHSKCTSTLRSCSTPFGINEWITQSARRVARRIGCVLNAFRHQRMDHLGTFSMMAHVGSVLNAFRHQRMDHGIGTTGNVLLNLCSTPFGINEWITKRTKCCVIFWLCAQRLSASTNGSLQNGALTTGGSLVLNAFRHQRMDHCEALE